MIRPCPYIHEGTYQAKIILYQSIGEDFIEVEEKKIKFKYVGSDDEDKPDNPCRDVEIEWGEPFASGNLEISLGFENALSFDLEDMMELKYPDYAEEFFKKGGRCPELKVKLNWGNLDNSL